MQINEQKVEQLLEDDVGAKGIFTLLKPYVGVLQRGAKEQLQVVLDAIRSRDWDRIDRELYSVMTEDERDTLGAEVLADARRAVAEAYRRSRMWQEDVIKVTLAILSSVV